MTDLSHIRGFNAHWTEKRPQPLELTAQQVLLFLGRHCESALWVQPTPEYRGGWKVDCETASNNPFRGATLEEAVCRAAATFKEVNGELEI